MRAGRLRHRLYLQQSTQTRTASGGYEDGWATIATIWGAVEPLKGREFFENAQVEGDVTHRIVIRSRAEVTTKHRFIHIEKNRVFNVVSVINPNERDISMEIMAKESVT